MGSLYRKTVTRPLPNGATISHKRRRATKRELQHNPSQATVVETKATWTDRSGNKRTGLVVVHADGTQRVRVRSETYYAKYRDGAGVVHVVPTGCRELQAARSKLTDFERTAERVRAGVLSDSDCRVIEHGDTSIEKHLDAYFLSMEVAGASPRHIRDTRRLAAAVIQDLKLRLLKDIDAGRIEGWLQLKSKQGLSPRTRNSYLQAVKGFCRWCIGSGRLLHDPLFRLKKVNEATDCRRKRRALSEDELRRLLFVARWRPLAEFGRRPQRKVGTELSTDSRSRKTWYLEPLSIDSIQSAVEIARNKLSDNPNLLQKLESRGFERALVYKCAALTGLRRGELAAVTEGHLRLDDPSPCIRMEAKDTKNREEAVIPLRADLVADLRQWIDMKQNAIGVVEISKAGPDPKEPLLNVPQQLVKCLDRDLAVAGIPKVDDRGRTVDVHALRHTFGTLLSKGGVAPRTAQAAMRHADMRLTMNVYTDPRLLDIAGAADLLPNLSINETNVPGSTIPMRATGTESMPGSVAPTVAPTVVHSGHKLAICGTTGEGETPAAKTKKPLESHGNQGLLFSEVDGSRTRNLRIDSPVLCHVDSFPSLF